MDMNIILRRSTEDGQLVSRISRLYLAVVQISLLLGKEINTSRRIRNTSMNRERQGNAVMLSEILQLQHYHYSKANTIHWLILSDNKFTILNNTRSIQGEKASFSMTQGTDLSTLTVYAWIPLERMHVVFNPWPM